MLYFGKSVAFTMIYMLGSITFGFIHVFATPGLESMKKEWISKGGDLKIIDNSTIATMFNTFSSLFASVGGFMMHFLIKYIKNQVKMAIFLVNIFSVIIWLLFFIITKEKYLFVGIILRSLQGLVLGSIAMITPILMVEIAPSQQTGMFGCLNQLGIILGFILYYIFSAFVEWRILVIIGAIVNALYCGLIWLTPELHQKGVVNYDNIFQKKHSFNLFCGVMMMIFQQLCGINAINANLSSILKNTGLNINHNLQSAISTLAQFLAVLVSVFITDAIGRRGLWIFSAGGIIVGLVMYCVNLKITIEGWYAALCVFLLMLFFGIGYGPIPWFIGAEMFTVETKTMGQSCITFANMICSFAVVFLFPLMTENLGEFITIIIFCVITCFSFVFGFWCVPNPKDRESDGITLL